MNPTGMTIKEWWKHRFFKLIDEYREAKKNLDTPEGKQAFVALSLAIHVAKGHVPKRLWSMVNK